MHVLIACKNEEDPNKKEVARVATTFLPLEIYGDFPVALGQVPPQSVVGSGQISNSSEILWFFSLPARMKTIRTKIKAP